ncbi:hypothetical protein [Gluconobacter sp. OJB]|uniref:hypothetical protein n=1 Tax=Gluconobacter sp. OJB TaxID=3145196 RepID=UPI0031F74161
MRDQRVRRGQDMSGGAEILFQFEGFCIGKFLAEITDEPDLRATPRIYVEYNFSIKNVFCSRFFR